MRIIQYESFLKYTRRIDIQCVIRVIIIRNLIVAVIRMVVASVVGIRKAFVGIVAAIFGCV